MDGKQAISTFLLLCSLRILFFPDFSLTSGIIHEIPWLFDQIFFPEFPDFQDWNKSIGLAKWFNGFNIVKIELSSSAVCFTRLWTWQLIEETKPISNYTQMHIIIEKRKYYKSMYSNGLISPITTYEIKFYPIRCCWPSTKFLLTADEI